jgi:hypothetical protein
MFVVLIIACTYGTPDCRALKVGNDLPSFQVCTDIAELLVIKSWEEKHPKDYVLKWACTDSPAYYLYRFDA